MPKVKPTFASFEDFMPAFTAARMACIAVAGARWTLDVTVRMNARIPARWANCKIFGGTKKSPRDVAFPRAQFWPGGVLPVGPEYEDPWAGQFTKLQEAA